MGAARPSAVLWDMDGTLIDSEPYWMETETALADAHGVTWTVDDALQLVGKDLRIGASRMRDAGVPLPLEEIVEGLLDGVVRRIAEHVPWRPGGLELLGALRAEGVPCALVTMSYERFVAPVLAALPAGSFDVVVTGDAVTQGKPHPEPYLHAARLLGVEPPDCVAIEDSNAGATSAEAAGCLVLVVPNHVEVAPGPRRVFRPSLAGLDPEDLAELAGAHGS